MVHSQATGRAQHCRHHATERFVTGLGQPVGPPRRLGPVLPVLVVGVGGRTDGHPAGENVLQTPRFRTGWVHPHGQVVHDPERHPGPSGDQLRRGQLLVQDPLQPDVEVDALRRGSGGTRPPRPRPATAGRPARSANPRRARRPGRTRLRSRPGHVLPARGRPRGPVPDRRSGAAGRSARAPGVWPTTPRPDRADRRTGRPDPPAAPRPGRGPPRPVPAPRRCVPAGCTRGC